jgi:DnaJ-domain-containing protein 1
MGNPLARVIQQGLQAMAEAMQEELGRMSQQLVQGMLTPEMLTSLIEMMRQSLKGMGMDIGQVSGMMGQQPGLNPYVVLGLDRSASDEDVKKRYRELVRKLHPDTGGTEGTAFLLQMVLGAYEMIKRERGWN